MVEKVGIGLTGFQGSKDTFAERFVDAVFENGEDLALGEIFANAFSDRGYTPNIIEAQHWSVEVLNASGIGRMERLADCHLITEIFCNCFAPYDTGELSLSEAKAKGVKMAEDFFSGTVIELMFEKSPENSTWFAAHIYRLCEEVEETIESNIKERKKLDDFIGSVDEYYRSNNKDERMSERRSPFVSLVNTGVKIGFLYRDAWWKDNHEEAAMNYYSLVKARRKGSPRGGDSTAEKYDNLKRDCLGYFEKAYEEKGVAFLGAPVAVVAKTIREIALRERPHDFIGPKGNPLSERWFLETLEAFQANGEFGPEIEKITKKALGYQK